MGGFRGMVFSVESVIHVISQMPETNRPACAIGSDLYDKELT